MLNIRSTNQLTHIIHSNSQHKERQHFKNDQSSWQVTVSKNSNRTKNSAFSKLQTMFLPGHTERNKEYACNADQKFWIDEQWRQIVAGNLQTELGYF